jgi:hypothetical protein
MNVRGPQMGQGSSHGPVNDVQLHAREPFYNPSVTPALAQQHTYSPTYDMSSVRSSQYNNSSAAAAGAAAATAPLSSSRGYNPRTSPDNTAFQPTAEDETVRFIAESWFEVEREMIKASREGSSGGPDTYREKDRLQQNQASSPDFVAFDLESWRETRRLNRTC